MAIVGFQGVLLIEDRGRSQALLDILGEGFERTVRRNAGFAVYIRKPYGCTVSRGDSRGGCARSDT